MTLQEIRFIRSEPDLPFPISSVREISQWNQISINNKIALPVHNSSAHYSKDRDISILHPNGEEMGILTFTKTLSSISLHTLTESQFVAFLFEADSLDYTKFKYDYFIINESYYSRYIRQFAKTAPIWGGFNHKYSNVNLAENYKVNIDRVTARSNLMLNGKYYVENSVRAIKQEYAFERFLKYYHLLELDFDYFLIEKIQNLDIRTESILIGRLLNEYAADEITRFFNIVSDKCNDINALVGILNTAKNFEETCFQIFNKYSKNKSLLKDETTFRNVISSGDFSEPNLRALHVNFNNDYNTFIKKIASYWIYRIRCSIAHNTIGEYIMTNKDEKFVVLFGEPLLKEVIMQCFTRHR